MSLMLYHLQNQSPLPGMTGCLYQNTIICLIINCNQIDYVTTKMTNFSGISDYRHDSPGRTGILLTNLGTPDSASTADLRKYLAEFLSDPRVIELPRILWWPILHGIILRTRPKKSARAYKKIWTEHGSPLMEISIKQLNAVKDSLHGRIKGAVCMELAMRYGKPSIKSALENLRRLNVQRLLVLPLYPQYSAATTASTFDAVANVLRTWRWLPELRMINHYHDYSAYINALVDSIREHWAVHGKGERLLFSFHGLPRHYFLAGDPYFCQCHKTARLVAEQLELADGLWQVTFQSRFGAREWLKPYTDRTLMDWGGQGIKNVSVICPGFAADCLETLEEIQIQNRDFFLQAGGEAFSYIPALNDHASHIHALTELILDNCRGWPEFAPDWDQARIDGESRQTAQRYESMKGA